MKLNSFLVVGVRIILVLKEIKTPVKNFGMSEYIVAKRKPSRIPCLPFRWCDQQLGERYVKVSGTISK